LLSAAFTRNPFAGGEDLPITQKNPRHPSLQFKKIGKFWSVRVGLRHRALAVQIPEGFLWFWIGLHDEYDLKIK